MIFFRISKYIITPESWRYIPRVFLAIHCGDLFGIGIIITLIKIEKAFCYGMQIIFWHLKGKGIQVVSHSVLGLKMICWLLVKLR
jgi:hypothetical protein